MLRKWVENSPAPNKVGGWNKQEMGVVNNKILRNRWGNFFIIIFTTEPDTNSGDRIYVEGPNRSGGGVKLTQKLE